MITVRNVTKIFEVPHERTKTLFHKLTSVFHPSYEYEQFYALRNVSIDVKKGEFVGVMGRNGSGKTTLLRIIAGVYKPTTGECDVRDEISPFLEIGVGFQTRLSCRDNIFIYGALLGFSRGEMNTRYRDIMRFAELERFADAPLDRLSSGMKVRLAFATAIQSNAPILLVDEVLAVGDRIFQEKCRDVFWKFKREGRTILFVSHDASAVKQYCDRTLVLDHGEVVNEGTPGDMIDYYQNTVLKMTV
jgi:lipopolysaccharide transport system ATP-binding protein